MGYKVFSAFIATLAFSVLFNSPRKELLLCGLTGAISWFFYELLIQIDFDSTLPTFIGAGIATVVSRFLAFRRRNPITIYLISGIIPLVPGSGIYYTVYYLLMNESLLAYNYGLGTLKTAGIITLGIMTILSLPYQLFNWVSKK